MDAGTYEQIFALFLLVALLVMCIGGLFGSILRVSKKTEKIWAVVILALAAIGGGGMLWLLEFRQHDLDIAHLEDAKTWKRDYVVEKCPTIGDDLPCKVRWYEYWADSLKSELKVREER